ncbi:WEB family protein-like [Forsythia ovata]|uniref:WEB family protein-like n=1 Tax=Forsythia ovata TaxID=205694 RepID=A0ABD1WK09_9LAMI
MAETSESFIAKTKKIVNPRVEIDSSPLFESVKVAVDRFGGNGLWIPHQMLHLAADHCYIRLIIRSVTMMFDLALRLMSHISPSMITSPAHLVVSILIIYYKLQWVQID